jgi:hypothetical protein
MCRYKCSTPLFVQTKINIADAALQPLPDIARWLYAPAASRVLGCEKGARPFSKRGQLAQLFDLSASLVFFRCYIDRSGGQ